MRTITNVDELGTILGVWAHPDDEAYLAGGTMAAAVAAGHHVACVTATVGEAGDTSDPVRWPREKLAEIRKAEMERSLAVLGVTDHTWLGYADGGLPAAPADEAIARIATIIQRVEPQTVLTFGPDGMTGHPDHSTVAAWTTTAFRSVAGPASRLLAATKTVEWGERFNDINEDVFPGGPPCTPVSELAAAITLDDATLRQKLTALEVQASQTAAIIAALGVARFSEWGRDELWAQLLP